MPVAVLVIPATLSRLLLALSLQFALSFTTLAFLPAILVLVPVRILCLGCRARHCHDAHEQEQSQDCASKFFDAVEFHCLLTSAVTVRNDHASHVSAHVRTRTCTLDGGQYSISCLINRHA